MTHTKPKRILFISRYDSGNYFAEILRAAVCNPPKPGTVSHVSIAHDDWCDLLSGKGPCNCNPDVEMLGEVQ